MASETNVSTENKADINSGSSPESQRTEIPAYQKAFEGTNLDPTKDENTVLPAQKVEQTFTQSGDQESVLGQLAGADFEKQFGMPDIYAQENQQTLPTQFSEAKSTQTNPITEENLMAQGFDVSRLQQIRQTGEMQDHLNAQDLPAQQAKSETTSPTREQQLAKIKADFYKGYTPKPPADENSLEYKAWQEQREHAADMYAEVVINEQQTQEKSDVVPKNQGLQNQDQPQQPLSSAEIPSPKNTAEGKNTQDNKQDTPTTGEIKQPEPQAEVQAPAAREVPSSAQRLRVRANEMREKAATLGTQATEMEQRAKALREQAEALPPTPPGQVRYNTGMAGEISPREKLLQEAQQLESRAKSLGSRATNLEKDADAKDKKADKKVEQAEAKKQEAVKRREEEGKELGATMQQAMRELGFDANKPMTLEEQKRMLQRALEITDGKLKNAKGKEKGILMAILKALGILVAGTVILAGSVLVEQGGKLKDASTS